MSSDAEYDFSVYKEGLSLTLEMKGFIIDV